MDTSDICITKLLYSTLSLLSIIRNSTIVMEYPHKYVVKIEVQNKFIINVNFVCIASACSRSKCGRPPNRYQKTRAVTSNNRIKDSYFLLYF